MRTFELIQRGAAAPAAGRGVPVPRGRPEPPLGGARITAREPPFRFVDDQQHEPLPAQPPAL